MCAPLGSVKVTAPQGTERGYIREFVLSKIEWIEKNQKRIQGRSGTAETLKNNSPVFIWGKEFKLEITGRQGNSKIRIEDGLVKMFIRSGSEKTKKQELLDRWRRRAVKDAAAPVIEKWESVLKLKVKKLYIRKMKTHWGSCNCTRQTLRLNSELSKQSPDCLEYVIIHEMLHIIEKGHNKKFYAMLAKYVPDWKSLKKKLNYG